MAHAFVEGVQFGILSDERIRAMGAVEVTEFTLHSRGVPKANSPADTRFGTCSRFVRCGTCKNNMSDCPNHPGYISLPYPIPHVGFIPYLVKIFNLYCFNCSGFLLRSAECPDRFNNPEKRMAWYYDEVRRARSRKRNPLTCPDCGLPQPTIRMDEPFVVADWYDDVVDEHFGCQNKRKAIEQDVAASAAKRRRKNKGKAKAPAPAEATQPEESSERGCAHDDAQASERMSQVEMESRRAELEYFVRRPFTNWDAYNVLRSIKKSDLVPLGIDGEHTHPAGMMLLSLVVPAIGVRPTMSFEEASRRSGYHQLTRSLAEILKLRRSLINEAEAHNVQLDNQEASAEFPEDVLKALQLFYITVSQYLVKNRHKCTKLKLSPYAARSQNRKQAVTQPLTGKEGRYRATLLGRRVDFSARTVITPGPELDIDQIGLPEEICKRLTIPIRVIASNRSALQRLLTEGEIHQIVDERTGDMIAVGDHNRATLPLMEGWVVERYLRDDDGVVVNRQPTLHKPSMMGHRVKRIPGIRAARLPTQTCKAYNADFDGDEMNIHVPQTVEARAEVQELLHVPNHIIHPRANCPIISPIQDPLDGGYYLSRQNCFFNRSEAMHLLSVLKYDPHAPSRVRMGQPGADIGCPELPPPAIVHPKQLWTGKQLFSCTLPRINLRRKIKNRPPQYEADPLLEADGTLLILNGHLLRGTLCNQSLGTSSGGIIHTVLIDYGNHAAGRFISDSQRLLNRALIAEGFSVGLGDCTCPPDIQRKMNLVKSKVQSHVSWLESVAASMPEDVEIQALLEAKICEALKSMLQMVGNIVRSNMDDSNRWHVMANLVGSKGSVFNVAQVMGAIGGTFVNGERPSAPGGQRVLPSAPLPGQAPLSVADRLGMQGYIPSAYKTGMRMPQAVMHGMGGREGLVDTSAKTARTGYIQRRLGKAMEGHHVAQDGSIRNAYDSVYQLWFGADGLEPTKTFRVKMDVLTLGDVELRRKHVAELQSASDPRCHRAATNEHALLKGVRDEMRRAVVSTFHGRVEMLLDAYIPFNVPSTVERFRTEMGCQGYEPSDVETVELHYAVVEACNQLEEEVPCLFSRVHLLSELSTARIKHKWRASPECIRRVIDECVRLHRAARIQPGDAVGIMTATSVGEPTTQMTLNTFHFAGVDNVGMTQGVPRMREIIGATKNMSTPLITLPMRKDLPNPKVAAELLARSLPHTVLRNVVKDARLVFEPLVVQTHVASDVGLVHEHLPFLEHVQEQASRWVIRIELDRDRASARTLEPRLVADLIQEELMDNALVVSSTVDDPSWVVRVYLVGIEAMVDAQFKKSRESGTTRAAARRSTQRPSLAAGARKRKQHMDMTSISDQGAHVSVPLHCIDPHVGHRAHSARAVVEWMVADNVKEVLRELSVGGLKGVSAAVVRLRTHTVFDSGGAPRDVVEPVVDVLGTGLAEAALLPAVDQSRVVSSDVIAVYETYGITAAAHVLYNELCTCLASSGARVDERLIKMVVDVATHDGYVMPISRHGLNRLARHGVLAKITFEETLRILFTSAVFGSYDPLLGVSENTIVGKPARLGTNLSQMYYEQDGELLECGADATASSMPTATLDTRVLKSVMSSLPESCVDLDEENDYEADMNAVYRDESLERILAVRRTRVDQITAATTDFAPSAVAHPDIYSFKLFQTNAKRASSSNDGPFRPSSPVLDVGAFEPTEYVASEPFRPSSPAI